MYSVKDAIQSKKVKDVIEDIIGELKKDSESMEKDSESAEKPVSN